MPSGPVAESESTFDSKLSTLSEEKDTESRDSWVRLGKVGKESGGFWTHGFDANTQFSGGNIQNCTETHVHISEGSF